MRRPRAPVCRPGRACAPHRPPPRARPRPVPTRRRITCRAPPFPRQAHWGRAPAGPRTPRGREAEPGRPCPRRHRRTRDDTRRPAVPLWSRRPVGHSGRRGLLSSLGAGRHRARRGAENRCGPQGTASALGWICSEPGTHVAEIAVVVEGGKETRREARAKHLRAAWPPGNLGAALCLSRNRKERARCQLSLLNGRRSSWGAHWY